MALVPEAQIALLRPELAFILLGNGEIDEMKDILPDLPFSGSSHVFIPILDPEQTHWSLLVISVAQQLALHYTSKPAPYGNQDLIQGLLLKIKKWYGWTRITCQEMDKYLEQSKTRGNSGVGVCITMRYLLLRRLLQASQSQKVSMDIGHKKLDEQRGRKQILDLLDYYLKRQLLVLKG